MGYLLINDGRRPSVEPDFDLADPVFADWGDITGAEQLMAYSQPQWQTRGVVGTILKLLLRVHRYYPQEFPPSSVSSSTGDPHEPLWVKICNVPSLWQRGHNDHCWWSCDEHGREPLEVGCVKP